MEYIYSAMLLYSAGKDITEDAMKAVLTSAGIDADMAKIRVLVSSLEGVNIKEAISNATAVSAVSAVPTASKEAPKKEAPKKEEPKEEAVSEEEAAAGLSALFG